MAAARHRYEEMVARIAGRGAARIQAMALFAREKPRDIEASCVAFENCSVDVGEFDGERVDRYVLGVGVRWI